MSLPTQLERRERLVLIALTLTTVLSCCGIGVFGSALLSANPRIVADLPTPSPAAPEDVRAAPSPRATLAPGAPTSTSAPLPTPVPRPTLTRAPRLTAVPTVAPEPQGAPAEIVTLVPAAVGASASAPDGQDAAGAPVSFAPEMLIDGQVDTAWRVPGDGIGQWLAFAFDTDVTVRNVYLVTGYTKIDPNDGSNRFLENRRVTRVRIQFSETEYLDVPLRDAPELQTITINPPVTTRNMWITIQDSTDHGGRDFAAISEVLITGTR
jgi:hypothetical protein